MEYTLKGNDGKIKHYEVSYSQVLQRKTNKLLMTLIALIVVLVLGLAFTLMKVDMLNIPTQIIYGG